MSIKDLFNKVEFEENYITNKEKFHNDFMIYQSSNLEEGEEEILREYNFHPIKNRLTNEIYVLSKDKDIRTKLAKLDDKEPLKVFNKYSSNMSKVYLSESVLFFKLVDQTSVIDKNYSEDQAQEFVQDLLVDASRKQASDIHISWLSDQIIIKYRIDGKVVLQQKTLNKEIGLALKNIFVNKTGELEYKETEVSGQLTEIVDGVKMEYRLSIGPTVNGYVIVIRLESHINKDSNLVDWGYTPKATEMIRRLFHAHHGIVLVTGATGSGKSTLLYTCIIEKLYEDPTYKPEILTVEDPVEILVDGVNQVQVNTKGDAANHITFTSAIKMFLRQDPDMVVVGEIRDNDVAMQAITAAKTGHLTTSTLHTNNIKSTFSRLNELGIDNSNIEDGVKGVISQKLLNKLCSHCKMEYEVNGVKYYKRNKEGCSECASSSVKGCKGRVPVVEIAELNNESENYKPENFEDYYSLEENIIYLVEHGTIDKEEARRYIDLSSEDSLSNRQSLLDLWSKVTKDKTHSKYLFSMYQPIVDSRGFEHGYESFMTMRNHKEELLHINEFKELAKSMNLFDKFSMYILDQLVITIKKTDKNVFWNIDSDLILDKDFSENILSKLTREKVLNKLVLEFEFKEEYKEFIDFCNKHEILISLDNFSGNMNDIIFLEKHELKINFIKTSKAFTGGILESRVWLNDYIKLLKHTGANVIINHIDNKSLSTEIVKNFSGDYMQGSEIKEISMSV